MRVSKLAWIAVGMGFACGGERQAPPAAVTVPSASAVAPAGGTASTSPAASASAAALGRTVLKVEGDQPGVLLTVDDHFVGPVPQEIEVTAGPHALHFAGARYDSLDRSVDVSAGQTVRVTDARLRVKRGTVTLLKATAGAKVFVENGTNKRDLPALPISVEMDNQPGWTVHATKAGYCDFVQPIDFSDGSPEKSLEIELHRPPCH